jgi:cytosine permease
MVRLMAETGAIAAVSAKPVPRWTDMAGAWLGIGTSPGALLLGAGIATRHQGPIPLLSLVLGFALVFVLVWFQGHLGLFPPLGDGGNLTTIAPRYFGSWMQRLIGALIGIGMTGWLGFNLGMGAAALGALIQIPQWLSVLVIGLPILVLSLRGIKGWNGLAALTTASVLVLVILVVTQLGAHALPITTSAGDPFAIITDTAVMVGYVSVFGVRAPDFTAGLQKRSDLVIVGLLLCMPLLIVVLAGVDLRQGTGSDDLVRVLAGPNGLAIGNLLITLAVIAPTFTTYYSGVPGLRAATGMGERTAMLIMAVIGTVLAIARFDLFLLSWLGILAAVLPPLVVPLAFESTARRRGRARRTIPMWIWLIGAVVSLMLTLLHHPLALLVGLIISAGATILWYCKSTGES